MNFLKRYRNQLLFSLIGIVIGFFIERVTHIKFQDEINPVDFANLFLTLIIAILIGYIIEPSNEQSRVEKELHIEQLKVVKEMAKELHTTFVSVYSQAPLSSGNKEKFVSGFRSLSNQIDMFFSQASHCKAKSITDQKHDITLHFFRYKQAVTGGHFATANFAFNSDLLSKYETPYVAFSKRINQLILDINRM